MKELFPSWEICLRYEEVIGVACGLLKNPIPLVEFNYEMYIERQLDEARTGQWDKEAARQLLAQGKDIRDLKLLRALYSESAVKPADYPLHNKYINYYNTSMETHENRPSDVSRILTPSRLYGFWNMKEPAGCRLKERGDGRNDVIPECIMQIKKTEPVIRKTLFSACRKISQRQPVSDLWMQKVNGEDLMAAEAPIMSRNARFLWTWGPSSLPVEFLRSILLQLSDCVTLEMIKLDGVDMSEVEEDFNRLLENHVTHHKGALRMELDGNNFSEKFVQKWRKRCEEIPSIDCAIN